MRESGAQKYEYNDAGKAISLKVPHVKSVRVQTVSKGMRNVSVTPLCEVCALWTNGNPGRLQAQGKGGPSAQPVNNLPV
jgi:hypothetical protein